MSMALVGLFAEPLFKYSANAMKQSIIPTLQTFLTEKLPNNAENDMKSSYVFACQEDPELKSFDDLLHKETSNLIHSFNAPGGNPENLSLLCRYLHDLSEWVAEIIIRSKEDVLKNEELKSLVDLYYESTNKTLNLFNTVEKRVKKTEMSLTIIRGAIKQFKKESMKTDLGGNRKMYEDTLEELNKVKAMGDPFGAEFLKQCESFREEQGELLKELSKKQVELEKKLKNVKTRRKMAAIVFGAAFFSVFVLSMYVCTIVAPLMVAKVAVGLTTTFGTAGLWVNKIVEDYAKALESRTHLLRLTVNGTKHNMEAMKTIENLVEKLITSISFILGTVELGVQTRDEEAVEVVMQKILKEVDGFEEKIENVGKNVAKCSELVTSGKLRVMEHINSSVSLKGKW